MLHRSSFLEIRVTSVTTGNLEKQQNKTKQNKKTNAKISYLSNNQEQSGASVDEFYDIYS